MDLFFQDFPSHTLPFDICNWSDILFLAPQMIVANRPDDDNAEDQGGPIEVRNIWVRSDREEHKDEQNGLEGHRSVSRVITDQHTL